MHFKENSSKHSTKLFHRYAVISSTHPLRRPSPGGSRGGTLLRLQPGPHESLLRRRWRRPIHLQRHTFCQSLRGQSARRSRPSDAEHGDICGIIIIIPSSGSSSRKFEHTSYLAGIVHLIPGDKLFVEVSNSVNVEHWQQSTLFGLFKV